jgi:hypothetical protein
VPCLADGLNPVNGSPCRLALTRLVCMCCAMSYRRVVYDRGMCSLFVPWCLALPTVVYLSIVYPAVWT